MTEQRQQQEEREAEQADAAESEPQGERDDSSTERAPLLANEDAESFRRRWEKLQTGFVDQPRQMVEQADGLVGELMEQLSAGFREERSSLEEQWEQGDDVSTEDLRVALTRYRSFFNRLLSA